MSSIHYPRVCFPLNHLAVLNELLVINELDDDSWKIIGWPSSQRGNGGQPFVYFAFFFCYFRAVGTVEQK